MPDVVSITHTRHTTLMEVAETLLDEEGQVEVSVLLDAGRLGDAQAKLVGAMDRLTLANLLDAEEAVSLHRKIGLSSERIEQLRLASADLW